MDDVHYINVDLEIKSRTDLSPIVDSFSNDVIVMYNGEWGKFFLAAFEGKNSAGVNEDIKFFCRLVECLNEKERKIWDESFSRIFDIGFQSGITPPSYGMSLESSVLNAVVNIGASIAITIYPMENRS